MPLNNFFKINFPYGIMANEKGEWTAFNREYKPLGHKDSLKVVKDKDFIYCKYKGLSDTILKKLADTHGSIVLENSKIIKVFFYSDGTNPSNQNKKTLYKTYFEKLEILSKLKV
jgi:hypothetical protein